MAKRDEILWHHASVHQMRTACLFVNIIKEVFPMRKTMCTSVSGAVHQTSTECDNRRFHCPECVMRDTCSDCSRYSADGRCGKWGGYCDPDKWACSWYYEH